MFTTSLTFNNSTFYPRSLFICIVLIWEQKLTVSIYIINRLVFLTEILPFTAQWPLHVPPCLTFKYFSYFPHSVFVCFLLIPEQATIILSTALNYHFLFPFSHVVPNISE